MSENEVQETSEITVSNGSNLSPQTSGLAQRGLDELARSTPAPDQINAARLEKTELKGLSDAAVRLVLEKSSYWEYRLFFQVLTDEVTGYESLRQARDVGFAPSASESPSLVDTLPWIIDRFDEVEQLIQVFNGLINRNLQAALGAPGESGDASAIILVSRQLGLVYKQFLDLSLRFMMTKHDKVFDGIFRELAKMHKEVIKEFEIFGPRSLAALTDAVTAAANGKPQSLELKMTLTCDAEPLMAEIDAAKPDVLRRIRSQQGY